MPHRYHPPPNWPPPPEGWTPPPGWQPDPAWGPPPEGWELWTYERANRAAWKWSFLSALGIWAVLSVVSSVLFGSFSPEGSGQILGRLLVPALIVALVAFFMKGRWPVWVYPMAVFGLALVLSAASAAGQMSA